MPPTPALQVHTRMDRIFDQQRIGSIGRHQRDDARIAARPAGRIIGLQFRGSASE